MGRSKVPAGGRARVLIDELIGERQVLARAQARNAELMVEFADTRTVADRDRIAGIRAGGGDARYKAGEFAANEVSMACSMSRYTAQRVIAMTRRVRAETPDAFDAWRAGDIDQDKVERINRALRRLQRASSKALLNALVVDVAVCKSPEILGRWLNQFILETEKDLQDERLERSFADRYVSVRPDLDGMSFLTAELSAVDAHAIDQVLTALAGIAEPGDPRTVQQRRADALVDVVLGRVTNGCHVLWDTNTDIDDHLDDGNPDTDTAEAAGARVGGRPGTQDRSAVGDELTDEGKVCDIDSGPDHGLDLVQDGGPFCGDSDAVGEADPENADPEIGAPAIAVPENGGHNIDGSVGDDATSQSWDAQDWEQPASVFRPDPHSQPPDDPDPLTSALNPLPDNNSRTGTYPTGSTRITACTGSGQARPLPVTIGIVVTAQSLFGFTDTPGQLMDRSAPVTADRIRELAQHKGTLFYRLLTDDNGNLLDITELGRFPSRKLAIAVKLRDGTCTGPTCTIPAIRSDIDHITPVPDGKTTADNLDDKCRNEHRAKTHAGHHTTRTGPHSTQWTTPTGHKYTTTDPPFITEKWPPSESQNT